MSFLWTKQTAILENLSNVETPGYKTKYVTFEEALQARLKAANSATQKKAAFREALSTIRPVIHEAGGESARMDENGVNAIEQGIELSRTGYQLQFVMDAINSNLNGLRTVIKG